MCCILDMPLGGEIFIDGSLQSQLSIRLAASYLMPHVLCGGIHHSHAGMVDSGEFFEYLEWPRNTFGDHLFSFMEAADDEGGVDFGDFVKVFLNTLAYPTERVSNDMCGTHPIS